MEIVNTIARMRQITEAERGQGRTIGLVPTMGALHEGHLELARRAKAECDVVVMSIFVNPIQFGPNEDFEKYPRTFEKDAAAASEKGVDFIFAPSVKEMYPGKNFVYVDIELLGDRLCGASRPGHFRGVATVVAKLFNIAKPHRAYFGMKDAQQLRILRRMNEDLDFGIQIVAVPTVREKDGLALSSRNAYLSPDDRKRAVSLSKSLKLAESMVASGENDVRRITDSMKELIMSEAPEAYIDYIEIVDDDTMQPLGKIDGKALVALAVRIGGTRLIDNVTVEA